MSGLRDALTIDRAALAKEQDRLVRGVLGAGKATVAELTKALERALEDATRGAAPGRLWRAWKSEVFPRGAAIAREPSGTVFVNGGSRSRGAIDFLTKPGRIRGKGGQFLAIPTPAAGPRGRARDLTPGEWERNNGARLRFVYRRGRPSLLVLDEGVLSGKTGRAKLNTARRRKSGRGNTTIVIFILLPMVAFSNRFAVEPICRRYLDRVAPELAGRIDALV